MRQHRRRNSRTRYSACRPYISAFLAAEQGRSFWPLILAHLDRLASPLTTAPRACRMARAWARAMLRGGLIPPAEVDTAADRAVVFTWREPGAAGLFALARFEVRPCGDCVVWPGSHPGLALALRCLVDVCRTPAPAA